MRFYSVYTYEHYYPGIHFSNQIAHFWYVLEGFGMEKFGVFRDNVVFSLSFWYIFVAIWVILTHFFVLGKIWLPCSTARRTRGPTLINRFSELSAAPILLQPFDSGGCLQPRVVKSLGKGNLLERAVHM
jgi:hypothetical protein